MLKHTGGQWFVTKEKIKQGQRVTKKHGDITHSYVQQLATVRQFASELPLTTLKDAHLSPSPVAVAAADKHILRQLCASSNTIAQAVSVGHELDNKRTERADK